jgi:hypothetical protein
MRRLRQNEILEKLSGSFQIQKRNNQTKSMKPILTTFKFVAAIALAVLAAGCASNNDLLDRENAAIGAGFKIITPSKPDQLALLQKLPPDKVTPIIYGGKPYYVLPDLADKQAYIGGPKQYQVYKQFRQKQKTNAEDYEATPDSVQVVEVNSMNWGEWGGWGPNGTLGEPGWY